MQDAEAAGEAPIEAYAQVLGDYIGSGTEDALYRASLLSRRCIDEGLGPEDIVALHFEALDQVVACCTPRERARAVSEAQQFLLEIMITYGVRYREYLEMRLLEGVQSAESRAELDHQRALD